MKRILFSVTLCAAFILGSSGAVLSSGDLILGLSVIDVDGDEVVYDATTGTYWYPKLTDMIQMTRAEQQEFIDQMNADAYGSITDWHFANYDQVSALKDSLAAMGTYRVEHEWPWTPPGTPRTVGSPFLAWSVQVDQFFTPTSVMTVGPPLVPAPILGGLPMQVFNGRITGWAWRTDVPATPPSWEYGEADDHFVVSEFMTPGEYATMTFNYDVHYLPDDATDRETFPGPFGAWVVSENGPLSDNFNRYPSTAGYGRLGPNWGGSKSARHYGIAANELKVLAGGPIYWKPYTFGPDQQAWVTLSRIGREAHHGVLLKVQGDRPEWSRGVIEVAYENDCQRGRCDCQRDTCERVTIRTYVPGQGWTNLAVFDVPMENGDQLGARALADGAVEAYVNGVKIGEADAGAFFADKGGSIGLWFVSRRLPRAILDNFGGR